jgi:hypothetical protein
MSDYDMFCDMRVDRDAWKARAEAAEALAQRYAAQSAVMAAGQCDGANGVALPGVYQFVRVGGPDSTSETCGRCGKHVSRHFGGTQYRCYSLRDDEQAREVFHCSMSG